jgi:hypothetical protein
MFRFIALPLVFSIVVAAAVLARHRRRRTWFRRAHDLTPVSEQWLADRRREG